MGFLVQPKMCVQSQRWRQGKISGQVAGSHPGRQPSTVSRRAREGAGTPSLFPEVPDIQWASLGRGLGHQWAGQSSHGTGWIWVLTENARARMVPDNIDHLRVGWRPRG